MLCNILGLRCWRGWSFRLENGTPIVDRYQNGSPTGLVEITHVINGTPQSLDDYFQSNDSHSFLVLSPLELVKRAIEFVLFALLSPHALCSPGKKIPRRETLVRSYWHG